MSKFNNAFLSLLTSSIQTVRSQLTFNVSRGPHEVGKLIEMDCYINDIIFDSPLSVFDIQVQKGNRQFYVNTSIPHEGGESPNNIHGFIRASMDLDKGLAICKVTINPGKSFSSKICLHVYGKYAFS